ncbi:MAG TPA: SpoIIE family protein phosphatase [Solirubrobacteraceae bacterium]
MSTDTSGAAHDLSGDELALVLDAACAVVFHLDVASGDVRWSGPVAALTGAGEPPASLEALLACAHPDDAGTLRAAVLATAHDGTPSTCDLRVVWPDATTHWLEARWRMVPEAQGARTIVGIARQIDDERASLGQLRFLADVSAALDASLDMERTLAAVANLCVRDLGDWCSIDLADADDELHNVAVAHVDPAQIELAQRMRERYPPRSRAGGGTAQVVRTGEPLLLARITEEQMAAGARDAEHLELIRSLGLTSVLMVPLRARGHVLGAITLGRTGRHPSYDEDDVAFVGEVARRAALALDNARLYGEARDRERDSIEAQALLDALVNAAPIGQGFLDTDFRYVRVNDALAEINGVPAIDHIGRTVREVLPALATDIEAAMEEVLTTGEAIVDLQMVGETRREPGRDRHYVASYYPVALARGERLGIGITVADVTDRAEAAQALREQRDLYEALMRAQSELGLAFVLLDGDRIVYANAATEALTGRSTRELYALPSILATLPLDVHRPVAGRLAGVREGREPAEPFRTEIQRPDGTRVPIETAGRRLGGPTDSRMAIIARDITDRVAQERELQRVLEVEQAARRASEAAHARVRLLADTSALLERSQTSDDALQEVAELLVARIADSCALDVLDLSGQLRRAGADARAPDGRRRMLAMEGDPEVARAMRADQPILLEDAGEGSVLGRSATLVPLVAHGRDVGVLSLGWREFGRRPARDEWSLIEALAQRIALAVDGALQYRERAHVAQTLQASLLPAALPDIPGASVAARYVASGEGMDVGGDFYDVFGLDDGSWILVIGDVLGKGAEAAAVTALARYTVRAVAGRSPSPAATLAALNDEMLRQRNPDRRFVTAVLARLEPHATGGARLVVASGGHPPPVLLRASGDAEVVPCPGTLLGVEDDARSFDQEIELGPGDTLVLYTDGVTEASREHPLSPEALGAALRASAPDGAAAVAREVVHLAEVGAAGAPRDDLAVLVVALDATQPG